MAKKYSSNWDAKRLIVSFNQKQWRQDFASFVREKKFWNITRLTRSKSISEVLSHLKFMIDMAEV